MAVGFSILTLFISKNLKSAQNIFHNILILTFSIEYLEIWKCMVDQIILLSSYLT